MTKVDLDVLLKDIPFGLRKDGPYREASKELPFLVTVLCHDPYREEKDQPWFYLEEYMEESEAYMLSAQVSFTMANTADKKPKVRYAVKIERVILEGLD